MERGLLASPRTSRPSTTLEPLPSSRSNAPPLTARPARSGVGAPLHPPLSPRQRAALFSPNRVSTAGAPSPRQLKPLPPMMTPRQLQRLELETLRRELDARTPKATAHHPLGITFRPTYESQQGYTGRGAAELISPRHFRGGPHRAPPIKTRAMLRREIAELEEEELAKAQYLAEARERAAAQPVSDATFKFWLNVIANKLRERFKQVCFGPQAARKCAGACLSPHLILTHTSRLMSAYGCACTAAAARLSSAGRGPQREALSEGVPEAPSFLQLGVLARWRLRSAPRVHGSGRCAARVHAHMTQGIS